MRNKSKYLLILIPVFLILSYFFTAMYSFHQIHKGIYYNDKKLIKEYVEWDELRDNFKDYLNIVLLKQTQQDESFKKLGELGILVTGFAGKLVEYTIDIWEPCGVLKDFRANGYFISPTAVGASGLWW